MERFVWGRGVGEGRIDEHNNTDWNMYIWNKNARGKALFQMKIRSTEGIYPTT